VELTDLRHFSNVAHTGGFTSGARRSHVTTPAVSKAVQKLELELGAQLFVRTTRRVELTDAGRELLSRCERIFAELEGLQAVLEESAHHVGGEIRIAAMEVFSIELLPRALASVVTEHPTVRPSSYEVEPRRMEQLLLDGLVEVGFTIGGGARDGIEYEELGRTTPMLVCGRSHPLYGRSRVRRKDLAEHASVVPRFLGRSSDAPLDQFPEASAPRRVGATIELLQMGVQLAIEGAYLGYFPEVSIRRALEDGRLWRLRGVRGATPFVLRALTRKGAPRRPVVRRVIEEVRLHVRRATT